MTEGSKFGEFARKQNPEREEVSEETSLPEILKRESKQFGLMLESESDPELQELGTRLMVGTLEKDDHEKLQGLREQYLERKETAKNLAEAIRGEYFNDVLAYSPKLRELCDLWGEKNIEDLLCNGLEDYLLKQEGDFIDLNKEVGKMQKFKETKEAAINDRIKWFMQQYSKRSGESYWSADTVLAAMNETDHRERVKILRSEMGFFHKTFDRMGLFNDAWKAANYMDAAGDKASIDSALKTRERILKESGRFMAGLISDREDYRDALATLAREGKMRFSGSADETQQSFAEVRQEKDPDPKQWGNDWDNWVQADATRSQRLEDIRKNPNDGASQQDLRFLQEQFGAHQSHEYKKTHRGFWASVVALVFGENLIEQQRYKDVMK